LRICTRRICGYEITFFDPLKYTDAPREGIRRIIERVTGKSIPKERVPTEQIEWIRMGKIAFEFVLKP